MPKYRVTRPSYRDGRYYLPGETIEVPTAKDASKTWVPLDETPETLTPAPAIPSPDASRRRRPSDSEPSQ
jgi:hypothetical protein